MSTTGNAYRFMPTMMPGCYFPMHAATETRVPGRVEVRQEDGKRWFIWSRELPQKGKKPKVVVITAQSVADLSAALEAYFAGLPS